MSCQTAVSLAAWKNCADPAACALSADPDPARDSTDEPSENKASPNVTERRGKYRGDGNGLSALDGGRASYPQEWKRHQDGFCTQGATGAVEDRAADRTAAVDQRAKRQSPPPDPATARPSE